MSKFTDWAFPKVQDDKSSQTIKKPAHWSDDVVELRKRESEKAQRWEIVFWVSVVLAVFGHIMVLISAFMGV